MPIFEYFPKPVLALQEEITYHPKLQKLLAQYEGHEAVEKLAEIAAYCGVLLDGYYTFDEQVALCDVLVEKLRAKRTEEIRQ